MRKIIGMITYAPKWIVYQIYRALVKLNYLIWGSLAVVILLTFLGVI